MATEIKLELKQFQKDSVAFALKNEYCILALQQGLGKSVVALEVARKSNSRTLIVCPAYLKLKWKSEIKKFYGDRYSVTIFDSEKEFYDLWDTDFCIISYSKLDKAEKLFEWASLVIYDEGHYIKAMNTKRSQAAHKLVYENNINRCLILTGTPIQNRVYEFYSLLALCFYNPKFNDNTPFLDKFKNYVSFANHFSYLNEFKMKTPNGGRRVVQQWSGIKNEDELKRWMKDIYIRFTADEIPNMPKYQDIEVEVAEDDIPELLEHYETLSDRASSVVSDVKAKAALAKINYTYDYVQGLLESEDQVVIYSDHIIACEELGKKFGVVGITGQTDMKLRQRMADEFMSKKSKVIVATIGSFSTGIDLISSNHIVFNDLNFVPGNNDQAKYRIRRIGQTKTCFFHYILASIQDKIILKKLNEKQKVIDIIV